MDFFDWLIRQGLQERSARDVRSRLKRLRKINSKFENLKEETLVDLIEKETDSPFVRSQLKRAVRLYLEFKCKH